MNWKGRIVRVAVVIPTRNAERWIGQAIESVLGGMRQPDDLLVVDGESTDQTRLIAQGLGARVVANAKRHAAAGRHLGLTETDCDVVASTDADCRVAPDWLARIGARFQADLDLDGVGGPLTLGRPVNAIQTYALEAFNAIMQFPAEPMLVRSRQMRGSFAESNCAYRREKVLAIGGYRDFFSNYAEGIDLFWRLLEGGSRLLFDPAVVVEHLGYPASLGSLVRTHFRYGIASTKLAKVHGGIFQLDTRLYRVLASSLFGIATRPSRGHALSACQVTSFLAGKLLSNLRYGVINL